jgi:hypothetical protein
MSDNSADGGVVLYEEPANELSPSAIGEGPPSVPDRFVLNPTMHVEGGTFSAGRAFAVRHPDVARPVILTCLHLFGTAGGYPSEIESEELPRIIKKVTFSEAFTRSKVSPAGTGFIVIPSAARTGVVSKAGDIVAIWGSPQANVVTRPLVASSLASGEPVWLASPLIGGTGLPRAHRATVMGMTQNVIRFAYDDAALELRATSGAPILNAQGEVVAINLGGGMHNGKLVGFANPASVFVPELLAACKRNPSTARKPGGP